MAVSKAQQKAVHKYVKSNYDRIELTVPKGKKDDIKAAATAVGESMNQYIIAAVDQRMERDRDKGPSEAAEAIREARAEYDRGQTVPHEAINWN